MRKVCALVVLFLTATVAASVCDSSLQLGEEERVNVLFVADDGGAGGKQLEELERAVRLASEHVNNANASCLLDGKKLHISMRSAQCGRQQALDVLHAELFNSTLSPVAVVGGGCSASSEAMAEVTQYYNLSVISYASSSIALDDRMRFPYFARTIPSDSLVALGMTEIITFFNWTRAVIITQDAPSYRLLSEELAEKLEERSVEVIADVLLPKNLSKIRADVLFPADVRIVALHMDSTTARYVMCEAFHSITNQYVWLTQGLYEPRWWEEEGEWLDSMELNCTATQLGEFLYEQRVLGVDIYPSAPPNSTATTTGDFSPEEFMSLTNSTWRVSSLAYDAIWTVVLALNASSSDFDPSNVGSQQNREVGESIRDNLQEVQFLGVSGEVKFENGTRVTNTLRILQYTNNSPVSGVPDQVGDILVMDGSGVVEFLGNLWGAGDTPSDGTPYTTLLYPHLWLVITTYALAALNIIAAIICLILNFVFRNRKLIRLSSPNLNYIIGFGAIIFCMSIFFFAYPELDFDLINTYCGARSWFAGIGYTLCFGTINTKMWRVYYIFHNPKPSAKKKPLKDWHLVCFVFVFVLVDLVILTISTTLDNVRLEAVRTPDIEHPSQPDENGITQHFEVALCESRYRRLWLGILLGYKAILQGIGVFLAFKIRKVKIKVLNDSKEITATLYLSSLILATVIIITLAFDDYLNVYAGAFCYGITVSSMVVLGVVFLSKFVRLYKDPQGDKLFTHVTKDLGVSGIGPGTCDEQQVHTLQRKVKNLEAQLTNLEHCDNIGNGKGKHIDEYIPPSPQLPTSNDSKHVQIVLHDD